MKSKDKVKDNVKNALQETMDVISKHESIIADDDQYDDPELWWAYKVRDALLDVMEVME